MHEALPRNLSGKVDRRALRAMPLPVFTDEREIVVPRTVIEKSVAAVWKEVLGLQRVGIHDNFFERGGHSLLVMQIVLRLRAAFEIRLPVRSLFDHPTIETFSKVIESTLLEDLEQISDEEAQRLLN